MFRDGRGGGKSKYRKRHPKKKHGGLYIKSHVKEKNTMAGDGGLEGAEGVLLCTFMASIPDKPRRSVNVAADLVAGQSHTA